MSISKAITTIDQLIEELNNVINKEEYKKLVMRLDIDLEEYQPYMLFSDEKYTRNCISRTKEYELLLLCWQEDQETPIHCHNNEECWVYVVQGEFDEKRYVDNSKNPNGIKLEAQIELEKDGVSYMNDDMGYHKLTNIYKGRTMSLHLYMNPIDECKVFNEEDGEFEVKKLAYHSYEGRLLERV